MNTPSTNKYEDTLRKVKQLTPITGNLIDHARAWESMARRLAEVLRDALLACECFDEYGEAMPVHPCPRCVALADFDQLAKG